MFKWHWHWQLIKRYIETMSLYRHQQQQISLKPAFKVKGNVLLSYVSSPFRMSEEQLLSYTHTNYWECVQIARTFLDRGYAVDVIDYKNQYFRPNRRYVCCIDIHRNLERLSLLLSPECIKILHITGTHWLFQNQAEYTRLLALQQRRGVALVPRRIAPAIAGIEHADYATILGNQFTMETFRYAGKPLYRIPLSTTVQYPWPEEKDFETCRSRFLWLGSRGLVHKGLDLVLEAFTGMPEYHLTVCGPVQKEQDFERAYYHELYQTPNIRTIGWVDVASPEFQQILKACVGLVYPSCSEGCSGSVITCLHAGLIPIISYESGVDVEAFGMILPHSSIEDIRESVHLISNLPSSELRQRSRTAWEFARTHHTRERFAEEYRKFVTDVLQRT